MILKEEKIVEYFNFKINPNLSADLFDYSNKKVKSINTTIEESTYIIRKKSEILRVDKQSEIEIKKSEQLLFHVRKTKNLDYFLENPIPTKLSEDNSNYLNFKLWYIINSGEDLDEIKNENYFLNLNDIIKFGNIKFIVKEINNKLKEKKEEKNISSDNIDNNYNISNLNENDIQIIDFFPQPKGFYENLTEKDNIICYICRQYECTKENPIIQFCDCNFIHYICLKNDLKKKLIIKQNEKETVLNYYINGLICKNCKYKYPLSFKISDKNFELLEIKKPSNNDYLILESIEQKMYYGFMKIIHVIKLNEENTNIINIGRNLTNDIIIRDPSISREHAELVYNKNNRKILLRNKSKKFGSLVLIKKLIKINNSKIQLQIGNVFLETQIIKYGDFEKIKDKNTENPLPKKY